MTEEYSEQLLNLLKNLKKDLGATNIRQSYRGTGTRKHRRQIFVRFSNEDSIDLWFESTCIGLGGVMHPGYGRVDIGERSAEDVYKEIAEKIKPLSGKQ
jgi:hypothetical protein